MSKEILDEFGRLLMTGVRDWSIEELDRTVMGKGNTPRDKFLKKYLALLTPAIESVVRILLPMAVDITIHYFLWLIEENKNLDIVIKTPEGALSLKKESDGLSGELYSEDGWIARYSKQRSYEDIILRN